MSKRNENWFGIKETCSGWIPKDRNYQRLDELCTLEYGSSPKGVLESDGVIPVVGTGVNVRNGNQSNAEGKTIIIGRKGSINQLAFFEIPIWVIDTAFYTTKYKNAYAKWLYHCLTFHRLYRYDESTGVPSLSRDALNSIKIPTPNILEQQKISEVLDTWDRAIELINKQIKVKEKLKKGLMLQLLTGKMRFPGLNEEWRFRKLGEMFTERNENDPTLSLLSITADNGLIQRSNVGRKDTSNDDKSSYKVIMPGDIGYNTMRMWQGRSAVSKLKGIVSPAYTVVTPKEGQCVDFWGYLFKLPKIINLFYRYSQGLVSDTLNLKYLNFSKIKIQIPSYTEQKKIAGLLSNIDDEIKILNKKNITLRIQKQGLMQKLLTGEVRVKV